MDSKTFRDLIGRFATGVTVVTTNDDGRLHGMTANAVSSLSLEPLLLLVCVARHATCHRQLTATGAFGLSILSADQKDLSNHFAQRQEPLEGSLGGPAYRLGELGVPLLEDALVHLECRVTESVAGGDHDIFIGEVRGGRLVRDAAPLLFFAGSYRQLAPASRSDNA